jgi:hypothetical protein
MNCVEWDLEISPYDDACPLCESTTVYKVWEDGRRDYLFCPRCKLIFVPEVQFLPSWEEKRRYDMHVNSPEDEGYRRFLRRLFDPMDRMLPPGSRGLDFGSGPGPTLSVMFEEAGHFMVTYDRFYSPDPCVFGDRYDFITATEVLEHVHRSGEELHRLWDCLKPGGWLGVMTKLVIGLERFSHWHYKEDPTHVRFFSRAAVRWIADRWDADLMFVGSDAFLLGKPKGVVETGRGRI